MSRKDEIARALIPDEVWDSVQTRIESEELDPREYAEIRRRGTRARHELVAFFRDRTEMYAALETLEAASAHLDEVREASELLATSGEWSVVVPRDVNEWLGAVGAVISSVERIRSLARSSPVLAGEPEADATIDALIAELDVERLRQEYARILGIKQRLEREQRIAARRPAPPTPTVDSSCAEDGCRRDRVFFDDDGVGYCKRHGNERGLRPHGKVT